MKNYTEKQKKELNKFYVKNYLKNDLKNFKKALFLSDEVKELRIKKDIKSIIDGMHGYMLKNNYIIKIETSKELAENDKNYILQKVSKFYNQKYNVSIFDAKSNLHIKSYKIYYIVVEEVHEVVKMDLQTQFEYYKKQNQSFISYELKKMIDKGIKSIDLEELHAITQKYLRK